MINIGELKQQAKRLRKTFAEFSGLSHSEALDVVSRLSGFRDYHEAERRLVETERKTLQAILQEFGGLIAGGRDSRNLAAELALTSGPIEIAGMSGTGKTTIALEICAQALAMGRPVRVFDSFGAFNMLRFITDVKDGCWSSEEVLFETAGINAFKLCGEELVSSVPNNSLVIIDEADGVWSGFPFDTLKSASVITVRQRPNGNSRNTISPIDANSFM